MKAILFFLTTCALAFSNICQADDLPLITRARGAGFQTCLKELKVAAESHLKDSTHTSHGLWTAGNTDQTMYSAVAVKHYTDTDSHISVVAGQTANGKCFTETQETMLVSTPCEELRKDIKDKNSEQKFGDNSTMATLAEEGPYVYFTSVQGGKSCLYTIRKQTLK